MDTICSGEQNPSAGFEHVLSCSLTTCFENYFENSHTHLFCVADGSGELGPPCCQISSQFSFKS